MENLTKKMKIKLAMQLTINDAIDNGHTDIKELVKYVKSEVFENSVKAYLKLIEGVSK